MISSNGVDRAPELHQQPVFALLHTFIILIFNVLFFNMFVGIVIEVYKGEMDKVSHNLVLNSDQRTWAIVQNIAYSVKPVPVKDTEKKVVSKAREFVQKLVLGKRFDYFIIGCIMANTVILALHWFYQSEDQIEVLDAINIAFNILFTIEAALKIYALRCEYF